MMQRGDAIMASPLSFRIVTMFPAPLTLILLPGLDGTARLFADFQASLPETLAVQAIAYPPDVPMGYAELADYVAARLPAEGKLVFLGESFSGPLSVMMTARFADRAAGLVLAGTFVVPPVARWMTALGKRFSHHLVPRFLIDLFCANAATPAHMYTLLHEAIATLSPAVVQRRVLALSQADMRATLARTACPLLVLHGARDRLIAPRLLRHMTDARPDATVQMLDAPHLILQTRPQEAAAALCDWLSTHEYPESDRPS